MAWFLRKSIRLGPLRLNLSKRGVRASVGVKGLRAGVDATGKPYVAGGRGECRLRHLGNGHPDALSGTEYRQSRRSAALLSRPTWQESLSAFATQASKSSFARSIRRMSSAHSTGSSSIAPASRISS